MTRKKIFFILSHKEDRRENLSSRRYNRRHLQNSQGKYKRQKKLLSQNIPKVQDTMKRSNLRIIGIEESKDSQLKGTAKILNKIIEENFPKLMKEMPFNI